MLAFDFLPEFLFRPPSGATFPPGEGIGFAWIGFFDTLRAPGAVQLHRGLWYFGHLLTMFLATWTPLAEAWEREWVMPEPSPMMYRPG